MGQAEPIEPQDDAAPGDERADWLCGPDEGLDADLNRAARAPLPAPTLLRPGQNAPAEPPEAKPQRGSPAFGPPSGAAEPEGRIGLPLPAPPPSRPAAPSPESEGEFVSGHSFMREAVQPSVPRPRPEPPRRREERPRWEPPVVQPAPGAPELRDFPMDDVGQHSYAVAAAPAVRVHEVVRPDAFDESAPPLPWWMETIHLLRTDRRIQVLTSTVVALLLVIVMWPRGPRPLSVGQVRRHPDRFDGQSVRLSGRVGEVFEVGGGYAFYLHGGRDTIVVFTRSRRPRTDQHLTVEGTVSTGYLDGQATSAVFEDQR